MNKTVLITGANGLIGNALVRVLIKKGYSIHTLSHSKAIYPTRSDINIFEWDVYRKQIDSRCIKQVDAIIHLAGEGIADQRWTANRKQQLIESRIESIKLIYSLLRRDADHQVKKVISASAIGYYGPCNDQILTEESPAGTDFLARLCTAWEDAVGQGQAFDLRTVCLRTGLVLSEKGGALALMAQSIRLGLGSPLGSGSQWISWIHLKDVVNTYVHAIENESFHGVYNMVAPSPVTNQELMKTLAQILNKPLWLPHVPAWILKLTMGEMSALVLNSTRVSADKLISTGFNFKFSTLADALRNLYHS